MNKTAFEVIPQPGETWSDNKTRTTTLATFIAVVDGIEPIGCREPNASVMYRRKGGGPIVRLRLRDFLWRFRRVESRPTGPFE